MSLQRVCAGKFPSKDRKFDSAILFFREMTTRISDCKISIFANNYFLLASLTLPNLNFFDVIHLLSINKTPFYQQVYARFSLTQH